jgi:Divergent InlB B-repeat domain
MLCSFGHKRVHSIMKSMRPKSLCGMRILIALMVVILVLPILHFNPVFAERITEDGFETGDFSKWTVKNGGFVTSGDAHHGTYKAVLNASGQYDQARFTNVDHCFFRAYVMFKSFPSVSGYETPILGVYNTSGIYMSEARVRNVSGTMKWVLRYFDNNGTTWVSYLAVSEQQNPVLNTWYCVEVEGKSGSATNAESRIYINGNELTDVSKTGRNNTYLINCAYIWESVTGGVTQWYDDVIVDAGYVGPECTLTANFVGSGSVAKIPDQTVYSWGTNVTLTANPTIGWSFDHWSGDASGAVNPITINMTSDKAVTATFIPSGPRTIYVPGNYSTITLAIAAADAGDTILVDPGIYNEEVVINKAVDILGSGAGSTFIDGTGVTLASPGLVKITAPGDVVFSGFTVRNAPAGPVDIFEILSQSSVAGVTYTISYDEIYGTNDPDNANDWGFYSSNDKANLVFTDNMVTQTGCNNIVLELHTGATEISHNTLDAGIWGTDAIYVMTYNGYDVTALQNVSYNTFNMSTGGPFDNDHHASAISLDTPGATWDLTDATFTNVIIEGNVINNLESYRRGMTFWNGGGAEGGVIAPLVKDNTIAGLAGRTESYGINFIGADATTNAEILNNHIYDCDYGIYLRTTDCAPGAQIMYNELSGNNVGLDNTIGSSDVYARYNYWGDLTGPYNAVTNPSGLGDPVTVNVDYNPYLTTFTPGLITDPESEICRKFGQTFAVKINVTNARGAEDFRFEIYYNATLLDVASITWDAWGSGNYTVDEVNGILAGYTTGDAISWDATLLTITFNATYYHLWKDESQVLNWKNDQTGTVIIQKANLSYPSSPDLRYERGGIDEIDVGPDYAYIFSPIQGDIDNNGNVEIFDLRTIAALYGTVNTTYDLTGDSFIDIFDLVVIARNFSFTYP